MTEGTEGSVKDLSPLSCQTLSEGTQTTDRIPRPLCQVRRSACQTTTAPSSDPGAQGRPGAPSRPNAIASVIVIAVIAYLVYSMGSAFSGGVQQADVLPTNQFVTAVEEGRVSTVTYKTADGSVTGSYWKDGADKGNDSALSPYSSVYVGSDSLATLMAEHPDVTYTINTDSGQLLETILVSVVPTLLLVGVFVFYMSRMSNQQDKTMSFAKTKARTTEAERPKVKFADVAGIDEAVEELQEIARLPLRTPSSYHQMGARIPRGVLLVGPPGTGKTLLAKAVAGEAGVPFFSISGSDFVEMFVGVGASPRARPVSSRPRSTAPCHRLHRRDRRRGPSARRGPGRRPRRARADPEPAAR